MNRRHNLSSLAILLLFLTSLASADLKIKTRTTVMGHTTESTVYIKGSRERNETSFAGRGGAVSIMQCDQKRMISITGNQCMIIPMGGEEASCPAMGMRAIAAAMAGKEPAPPRKGGVVTITRTVNDTGERQQMFGYKARHIKSTMVMESSPDACNQSHTKMEVDGWYADVSAEFSCGDESYRSMACGGTGGREGCSDRIVMKGSGGAAVGFPLKQTTTIITEQRTFTTTTEVVELTKTSLEEPLFEMPPGCKVMDMSAMMGVTPTAHSDAALPEPASSKPAAPAAPAAPAVPAKAAGIVRVGVVKIKDMSGQGLPTDNLRLNLMSEIGRNKMEAIPLETEGPYADMENEARSKQCDYVLYTVPTQVKDPGTGGLPSAYMPKGVTLDPNKHQALTNATLYKVGQPHPQFKDVALAADANQLAVNAVMATFVLESDKVAQQVDQDAHPKPASKTAKTPVKKTSTTTKPH